MLPHGDYVLTFTPPRGSEYRGVHVTATFDAETGQNPWWIFLKKR